MKRILLSGFWASHSIELSVEGFFIDGNFEYLAIKIQAKDSSCRALYARSWATGSIPARGPIVALFATAPG